MKSRAYRATGVKRVDWEGLSTGREGVAVRVGFDVGKEAILAVARWEDGRFERPWLVQNPGEVEVLVKLLRKVGEGRKLELAMEPTGTYGDVLRQAIADAGWRLDRVSPKAAHDYAEVFDGVPSQHDGKDAAVVAELAALGKAKEWSYGTPSEMDQEMSYWVDWMDAQQRQYAMWLGRLEGLMARHWPEARSWLKLSSGTLLRLLSHYGGPAALGEDKEAAARLAQWGGRYLEAKTIRELLASAKTSVGVRQGEIDRRRMQQYASQAWTARQEVARSKRRLEKLGQGDARLKAQAAAVGMATACVLRVHLGEPSSYHSKAAYRKAMGLNLSERSSGLHQGKLKISKRGSSQVRRWLYLAALRLVRQGPVARWYQRKKAKDGEGAKRAVIGVMRKLALALHVVGTTQESFRAERLFPGRRRTSVSKPQTKKNRRS
jgi:transposase